MKFLETVLLIMFFMAVRDLVFTYLTIYEARGDGEMAGRLDATGDMLSMLYTVIGVDALIKAGFSLKGIVIMVAIGFTSYNTTKWATYHLSRKLGKRRKL